MKTKQFLKSLSSLQRCAAVLLLLLIPLTYAWADQTLFTKNFNTMTSASYTSTTDRVSTDGIKYYVKSGKSITITNGTGVIFNQNAGTGSSFHGLAIPLTGVRQSLKITMTVPYSSKSTWKYKFVGGGTVSDTPPGTVDQSDKDASGTVTINISSLTNYTGVLYIGRAGSSYTTINNITVTTPNLVTHTLTNVTKSSGDTIATSSANYTATFAAAAGYTLPASITVMRDATNITANCTWTQATGSLTIPKAQITGNITVTITGESAGPATYTVSATANPAGYGSVSPTSISSISSGTSISTSSNVLTVGASSITATATSAGSDYSYAFSNWTKSDGTALPSTVTADLAVRANFTRTPQSYTVTHSLTNVTTSSGTTATYGTNYTATFAASSGYTLPSTITVMRGSTNITANCTWVQATGSLTIPGAQNTGNITVTITGDEITTCTVTYDGSDATGGDVPTDENSPYTSGSTVTVLGNSGNLTKAFDATPATFIGWNTNSNTYSGTHYDEDDQFTISGNTTLYAVWGYPITYDADGGTINDVSYPSYYICTSPDADATTTLPSNVTKDGYTFVGWKTENGSGTIITEITGDYTGAFTGDYKLKAIWSEVGYTVSYSGNGNTGGTVPSDATTYSPNAEVTVLGKNTLSKSGYTFVGWSDANSHFYVEGDKFEITDNVTLTAVWDGGSTAFYHGSITITTGALTPGSTGYHKGFFTNTSGTIATSSAISLTSTPGEGGYYYESTTVSDAALSNSSNWNATSTSNRTIRAFKYKSGDTYTLALGSYVATSIKFYGKNGSASKTMTVGGVSWTCGDTKEVFQPHEFTKSGGFTGNVSITQDGDFYGILVVTCTTYTGKKVSFNKGSGPSTVSGLPADRYVPSGSKISRPATDPTATGYIFNGWVTTSGGSTLFDFSGTITTDKTIYAKWTAKTQPTQYTLSGDSYYCPSGTATLTLSGSQSGISYQLLKGGSASGDPVAGTGSALEWEVDAAGTYTVKAVENATYSERTMSGSVTVAAAATTAISTQPTTSVSATASVNFTLGSDMVTAGHGLGYQWYSYTSSGGAGEAAVDGAESATYTTSKSAGTYYYKVKVSGDCGDPVYSNMITVTVKIAPNVYSLSGEPTALCGGTATLTLSGSQSGLNYQLYKGGVAEGDPKSGTGSALTWTGINAAGTYTVKTVETSTYAEATMSSSAVITVYTITSITRQPYTTGTAYTTAKTRNWSYVNSIEATGSNLEYQWYYCNESGGEKSEITGQNSADLNFIFTNDRKGTQHICCVVSGECGEVQSSVVTITVYDYYYLTYRYNKGSGGSGSIVRPGVQNLKDETWAVQILQRTGYRCVGWNTDEYSGGTHYDFGAQFTMPEADVDLFAEWADAPQLKWNLNVKTAESSIGTSSKESNNAAINNTTDMSNLLNSGLTITSSAKDDLTSKIEAPASKDDAKYMYVTFDIPDDYEYIPTSVSVKAQPVGGTATLEFEMVDAAGHSLSETYTNVASGSIATKVMSNTSKVGFTETATLKIYCYGSGVNTYRLGTPITIDGYLMYICPERPTIVKPASAKALNVYADESKTLSVEVETYNSGALTYQWKKDGANIAGANSATYTVVGSTLTVGTTYAYTCDVTEEGACASVTSPAFNVKTASPNCGYNEIANAVLTAKNSATTSNATALYQNMSNSSAPYKLDKTLPSYFGLQLSSGNFQVGDSIIFKVKINDMNISGYDDYPVAFYHSTDTSSYTPASALYIAGGQTKNTDNIYIRFVVSQAMIDAGLTNKILIIRSGRVTQNHSMYEARIKRYTCPDVVMFDANTNSNWGTTSNWVGATGRGAGLPTSDVRALITKPVTVNVTNAVAGEVVIDQHSSNTGKLIIPSTGVLNVEGPITKTTNGTSLSATDVADVVIDCGETSQGALIFEQPASGELQTQGTVNFYTKSSRVGGKLQWQYVGYPFISGYDYDYGGYYINKYSETQGGWIVMRDQGDRTINAWDGLAISGDGAGGASMTGTFVPTTGDKEFTLTYTAGKGKGKNLIGNSWTAPIQILEMEEEDFGGARAAIYVFNTGRYGSKEVSPSGSWVTLAIDAVKAGVDAGTWTNLTVIPAFQGFQVKTAATANKTLTLNYDKHVRPATDATAMNEPLRAPARRANSEINHMRLTVESDVAHQDVFLFEGPEFSEDFDNGWDGDYVGVSGQHAYLYVVSPKLGKMAIDAESSLEGRIVALQSAAEKEYTFTFAGNGMGYYLNDLKTQTSTLIEAGNSYTFTYEQGDDYNRFMISATPFAKTTPTGVEDGSLQKVDGVQKVLYKDHMYIIRGGRMFDATGAMVK